MNKTEEWVAPSCQCTISRVFWMESMQPGSASVTHTPRPFRTTCELLAHPQQSWPARSEGRQGGEEKREKADSAQAAAHRGQEAQKGRWVCGVGWSQQQSKGMPIHELTRPQMLPYQRLRCQILSNHKTRLFLFGGGATKGSEEGRRMNGNEDVTHSGLQEFSHVVDVAFHISEGKVGAS